MILKEIGCKNPQHETFPFISCSRCDLTQGDMWCIDFRKTSGAKMMYGIIDKATIKLIEVL